MNKQRRKVLKNTIEMLNESRGTLEMILDEERESYDNLPESLIDSDRGMEFEENIDALENIISSLEDVIDEVKDLV